MIEVFFGLAAVSIGIAYFLGARALIRRITTRRLNTQDIASSGERLSPTTYTIFGRETDWDTNLREFDFGLGSGLSRHSLAGALNTAESESGSVVVPPGRRLSVIFDLSDEPKFARLSRESQLEIAEQALNNYRLWVTINRPEADDADQAEETRFDVNSPKAETAG